MITHRRTNQSIRRMPRKSISVAERERSIQNRLMSEHNPNACDFVPKVEPVKLNYYIGLLWYRQNKKDRPGNSSRLLRRFWSGRNTFRVRLAVQCPHSLNGASLFPSAPRSSSNSKRNNLDSIRLGTQLLLCRRLEPTEPTTIPTMGSRPQQERHAHTEAITQNVRLQYLHYVCSSL